MSCMSASTHFDRRGPSYDADETHRRILAVLISGTPLLPGMRVLDIATGTGAAAIKAAERLGAQGSVLGVDISEGMLVEARRKAAAAGLEHVEFVRADVEELELPAESFDVILCASGLVLMRDIPRALRRWAGWLRATGSIGFDVPAKPFGISQMIAEAAAGYGVTLPYDTVADTAAKCRALLEDAGLEAVAVQTEVVSEDSVDVAKAIAFLEERLDHPAWRALKEAPERSRALIREAFVGRVLENATAGRVQSRVVQHFVYGRKAQAVARARG